MYACVHIGMHVGKYLDKDSCASTSWNLELLACTFIPIYAVLRLNSGLSACWGSILPTELHPQPYAVDIFAGR